MSSMIRASNTSKSESASENPLDVLSRAATMVEKSSSPPSPVALNSSQQGSKKLDRSPSFKERHPKFRKSSTPDYLVALESARNLKRQNSLTQSESMEVNSAPAEGQAEDLPLDMSIKKRPVSPPPPPPYRFNHNTSPTHFKSIYKSPPPYHPVGTSTPSPPLSSNPILPPPPSYEESTVKCTYPTKKTPPPPIIQPQPEENQTKIKEITIITNSSADPLLDEHFRRSLGADYESLFTKKKAAPTVINNSDSESSSVESTPPKSIVNHHDEESKKSSSDETDSTKVDDPVKAFQEDMEMEGYTVEDHFAKALGDTWIKLQKAEEEKQRSKSKSESSSTEKATTGTKKPTATLVVSS